MPLLPVLPEIVAVDLAENPDSPPELVREVWPGYLAGAMLLVRAGVVVRAGIHVIDPVVAARSRMYWAWWRPAKRGPADARGHRLVRHRCCLRVDHGEQWPYGHAYNEPCR
jgi:hypothetical protein